MSNNSNMMAIAVSKSLCKEYNTSESVRTVYLKNGDEFQIQLFNPEPNDIAASIWINGNRLSNQIVIRPGERIWLERYIDIAKKFKFETYEVEDGNSMVNNAIRNNGNIEVSFYHKTDRQVYANCIKTFQYPPHILILI